MRSTNFLIILAAVLLLSSIAINAIASHKKEALFAGEVLLFAGSPDYLEFSVSTTPSNVLECDQEITVNLNIKVNPMGREPFDSMLVLDRSKSMNDCSIASGNILKESSGSIGGGTWQQIDSFTISALKPFDVLMKWAAGACSGNCPKIYIEAPNGTKYGEGYTTPNNYTCNLTGVNYYTNNYLNYIAIGSALTQNGTWKVYAYKADPAINYTLKIKTITAPKTKLEVMEDESIAFLSDAKWRDPQDPLYDKTNADYMGYVRFGNTAKVRSNLPNARQATINSVNNDPTDSTNNSVMGAGITEANGELTGKQSRTFAKDFIVLFADGYSTDSVEAAVQFAAANNITIYTIAYGPDADRAQMEYIANATGGIAYYAEDEATLKEVYELIAYEIIGRTSEGANFYDSMLKVPVQDWISITAIGPTGQLCDGGAYICFDIGDLSATNDEWQDYYKAVFPCNNDNACQITTKIFPEEGTYFYFEDEDGNPQTPILWDETVTVIFYYRNLVLDVTNAKILPFLLDVNLLASSVGYLDNQTYTIGFYEYDEETQQIMEPPLKTESVTFGCAKYQVGCTNYTRELLNVHVPLEIESGRIIVYAIINYAQPVGKRDCPAGNIKILQCFLGPESFYYVLDLYLWEK